MSITKLTFGRNASPIGIGQRRPTLTWRFGEGDGLSQTAYEVRVGSRVHRVESSNNIAVPWPADDLVSRERVAVAVRVRFDSWSEWYETEVEASLLEAEDWSAEYITTSIHPPPSLAKRPFHTRTHFDLSPDDLAEIQTRGSARIYATALGVYDLHLNGHRFDHVLAPGWQSYKHRRHFQTYVVPAKHFHAGRNELGAIVGEGWYAGRLTWVPDVRNVWGDRIGVRIQLEYGDQRVVTNDEWEWSFGPLLASELYDGETYDPAISHDWQPVCVIADATPLYAPESPPIRITERIKPIDIITTPSGKSILDFGQNMVGWVQVNRVPAATRPNQVVRLRFAEVLEHGELCVAPLRSAKATDTIHRGTTEFSWQPTFTFHGFRFVEVSGMPATLDNFVGCVIHTDMERLGEFDCSHEMVRKFHENAVWGWRGNAVGVPTDCPQRDERMGWTGDLQAFARTACYLYDTSGFLGDWFKDLVAEQFNDYDGLPPLTVPELHPACGQPVRPLGVWGDVTAMTPNDMYNAQGDRSILQEMYRSMTAWLEHIPRRESGLWADQHGGVQLGDWLDPTAPVKEPLATATDPHLVADAFLVASTDIVAKIATILGKDAQHPDLRSVFRDEYISPKGRLGSDTQAAYALALKHNLLEPDQIEYAVSRLVHHITRRGFRIGTGFAGTAIVLDELAKRGETAVAYRMLLEEQCPSFLYPITMGATTVWERWDSMKPDGTVNTPLMTSFNHYALGAAASFLHAHVGGLSPLEPGWRKVLVQPRPGGDLTWARTSHITPSGLALCEWEIIGGRLIIKVVVPVNCTAHVILPTIDKTIASGKHTFDVAYTPDPLWPPKGYVYAPQPRKK